MPPRKKLPEPEPVQDDPVTSEEDSDDDQSAPEPPKAPQQRGANIQAARAKALEKLRERSEFKRKQVELKQLKEQAEKELLEAETLKARRDLEDLQKVKKKLVQKRAPLKKRAPPKKRAPTRTPSESDGTESEAEPESRSQTHRARGVATREAEDIVVKRAYENRLDALRRSILSQVFS